MTQYVYTFGAGEAQGNANMRNLLGGKGANLAEMTSIGLPVPQGFTITTEACTQYYEDGKQINDEIQAQIMEYIEKMEQIMDFFRNNPPKDFAGIRILEIQDYKNGFNGLGPSNVLKYVLEDHNMVVLRPSGTEPKLKLYIGAGAPSMKAAEALNDRIVAQMDIESR